MKSRDAAPEPPSRRPGLTWLFVPLAALVTSAVLGLAVIGGDGDARNVRELSLGPLLERPPDEALPRGAATGAPEPAPRAPLPTADEVAPITLSAASRMVPIEVYSASWCTACASAERWMDDHDIAYSEIDVDRHPGARDQLLALNPRRTLPTFDVAGDVLIGFDPTRLGAAIEGAARRRVR